LPFPGEWIVVNEAADEVWVIEADAHTRGSFVRGVNSAGYQPVAMRSPDDALLLLRGGEKPRAVIFGDDFIYPLVTADDFYEKAGGFLDGARKYRIGDFLSRNNSSRGVSSQKVADRLIFDLSRGIQ
jgi:hypothetical protein